MLFDPRASGSEVAVSGKCWQSQRSSAPGRRPAHDFLTLPAFGTDVSTNAVMRWKADQDVASLVAAHFESGILKAGDVPNFKGAGHALAHGFFAWATRNKPPFRRLNFNFVLCDVDAVLEEIQYQYDSRDFSPESALYLGIEIPQENVFEIGPRAAKLRRLHPRLVSTAMVLINRAAGRTLWVRTPDEFLGMFASWYWDGDPHTSDEDAKEVLEDRFGEDEEEMEHYFPSVVRPELCPDDMDVCTWNSGSRRFGQKPALGVAALRRLQRFSSGWVRQLCRDLEVLTLMLRAAGNRSLFNCAYQPGCAYAASTLIVEDGPRIGELLDSHYEHLASSGDGSLYYGFVPFASTPDAIRTQYADWSMGLSILGQLDRVLAGLSA